MTPHLPELGTNLVTALASLDVHNLTHLCEQAAYNKRELRFAYGRQTQLTTGLGSVSQKLLTFAGHEVWAVNFSISITLLGSLSQSGDSGTQAGTMQPLTVSVKFNMRKSAFALGFATGYAVCIATSGSFPDLHRPVALDTRQSR